MTDVARSTEDEAPTAALADSQEGAQRVFSTSILLSAIRCVITYVLLPWVFPLLGLTGAFGPALGVVIGVVAIGFNVWSIQRFWAAKHPWRRAITVINVSMIVLVTILVVLDLRAL